MSNKQKTKNDIILIVSVLLLTIILFLFISFFSQKGNYAVVTVNGEEIERYPLSQDIEKDIITNNNKKNTLVIKDGEAYVSYADCPDKVCVSHRKISKEGQAIICLPHKLVISIELSGK